MLGLCDRFHCLPSQLYDEPVDIVRLVELERLARPEEGGDPGGQ